MLLKDFLSGPRARSGNVAIMAAIGATVMIGGAAFAVDAAKMFVDRRQAQSIADLAALAAAADPLNATVVATGTAKRNGMVLSGDLIVETGNYVADPQRAVADRFVPGPAKSADAVRVELSTTTPTYFGRIFGAPDQVPIRTSAIASSTAIGSFGVGSRLLGLDGGVLNALLGSALGGKISLSVMDYRTLADLQLDAFQYADALATRARLQGPTYDEALAGEVKVADVLHALVDVGSADPAVKPATLALLVAVQRAATTAAKISLGSEIDLGPYGLASLGEPPRSPLTLSALSILTATARLADGEHQLAAGLALDVPGLASVKARLTIGERPKESGWVAVGRPGASVSTAQTRLKLDATIAPVGLGLIHLPIYVDVAKADARLASVKCPTPAAAKQAALAVTPAVAEAWIGHIPPATWDGMLDVASPPPAALIKLGLLSVTAKAHVRIGSVKPQTVTFSAPEIDDGTVKTVSSKNLVESLTGSLVDDLQLGVNGIGLLLPAQKQLIGNAIRAVAAPLDGVISALLAYLGVGLGQADVWVNGVRCDAAVLVN